jgi:predicted kinase
MFIVFDLDGTIADCRHRVHFVRDGGNDWDSFFAECVNDPPILTTIAALNAHYDAGHRVEIWSARSAVVERETIEWLIAQKIDPALLTHMRAAGDMTPDVDLKRRWLLALHPDERPDIVFDDRQRVVDMWRSEDIVCFQVAANWESGERTIAPICEPLLTIMVGPSGGGKSTWAGRVAHVEGAPEMLISSDALRYQFCGDESDQSRNLDVFHALHKLAKARLECGLPTIIDATNIRRKDRLACVALAPAGVGVRYVVCNRPLANKHATAGRRAGVMMADGRSLIDAHEQTFQSQLKDILRGDGLPNVTVLDARGCAEPELRVAA